jgi:hypothetical protein
MPETVKDAIVAAFLKPVMELWASRDERGAAEHSGRLRFWKDGMLEQLREFAGGKGTAQTYRSLRSKLRTSEDEATAAIVVLKKVRNKLGGGPVARAIDDVLNHEDFGKQNIRFEIKQFSNEDLTKSEQRERASTICNHIERLNLSLDQLHRLVYDEYVKYPQPGYEARACGETLSAFNGPTLPCSSTGPSRASRFSLSVTQAMRLRAWLLLARMEAPPFLRARSIPYMFG